MSPCTLLRLIGVWPRLHISKQQGIIERNANAYLTHHSVGIWKCTENKLVWYRRAKSIMMKCENVKDMHDHSHSILHCVTAFSLCAQPQPTPSPSTGLGWGTLLLIIHRAHGEAVIICRGPRCPSPTSSLCPSSVALCGVFIIE